MAFFLGNFTSGLFGGMSDAMSTMNAWEGLKQRRLETQRQQDMMDAGKATTEALKTGAGATPDIDTKPQPPSVTDTSAPPANNGPIALHPGRDAAGRPDISSMPLPNFMQPNKKPAVLLPQQKATQGDVRSFGRGSRETGRATGTASVAPLDTGASAAIPPAPVDTGASAAIPPAPVDTGASAAIPAARTTAPQYLPPGAVYAPIPPRTQAVPTQSAPPSASPSLSQQQTQPSLGMQIINSLFSGGAGF
jgi:hypothetical protein